MQGKKSFPSKYSPSPVKIGSVKRAKKRNDKLKQALPGKIEMRCASLDEGLYQNNDRIDLDSGKVIYRQMKGKQYARIPDFWSSKDVYLEEMVYDRCFVCNHKKNLDGLIGTSDSIMGCLVPLLMAVLIIVR